MLHCSISAVLISLATFVIIVTTKLGWQRIAAAERALHQHGVEPASVLEADRLEIADQPEADRGMDRDRGGVGGISDHADHLTEAAGLRLGDQARQQQPAY